MDRARLLATNRLSQLLQDQGSRISIKGAAWSAPYEGKLQLELRLEAPPASAESCRIAAAGYATIGDFVVLSGGGEPPPVLYHGTTLLSMLEVLIAGSFSAGNPKHCPVGVYGVTAAANCATYRAGGMFSYRPMCFVAAKKAGDELRQGPPREVPEGVIVRLDRSQKEWILHPASLQLLTATADYQALAATLNQLTLGIQMPMPKDPDVSTGFASSSVFRSISGDVRGDASSSSARAPGRGGPYSQVPPPEEGRPALPRGSVARALALNVPPSPKLHQPHHAAVAHV